MRVVVIPAHFVSAGWHTPTVCARHGETAVEQRRVTFRSLVPGWIALFILIPLLIVVVAFAVQRRVTSPAWPFCSRCNRMRAWGRGFALGMLALAVAFEVFPFIAGRNGASDGHVAIFLIGQILLLLGLLAFVRSSLGRIANGYVAANPSYLEFRKPHPEFVREVAVAKETAEQHYTQQFPAPGLV
ncbi:hypothetical protein ACWKSP_09610 [Micromonosporaceae bacterium Da 78-11]